MPLNDMCFLLFFDRPKFEGYCREPKSSDETAPPRDGLHSDLTGPINEPDEEPISDFVRVSTDICLLVKVLGVDSLLASKLNDGCGFTLQVGRGLRSPPLLQVPQLPYSNHARAHECFKQWNEVMHSSQVVMFPTSVWCCH